MSNKSTGVTLLIVLLAVLIGYVGANYLIKPLREETNVIEQTVSTTENELRTRYYLVSSYPFKARYLVSMGDSVAPFVSEFYAGESEEAFLDQIRASIRKAKVEFSLLSAQETQLKLDTLKLDKNSGAEVYRSLVTEESAPLLAANKFDSVYQPLLGKDSRLESETGCTTVTLEVFGTYRQLLSLIESLTGDGKSIICRSMTLDIAENAYLTASADPEARLMVTLDFISVPDAAKFGQTGELAELPAYTFPQDILFGTYRTTDGFTSMVNAMKNFFEEIFS